MMTTDTPAASTERWCSKKTGDKRRPMDAMKRATKKWVMGSAGTARREGRVA